MLTRFYKQYLQLQRDIKKHPMKIINDGHTYFDIQVANLGDKNHIKLEPDQLNRLEKKDFDPINLSCQYAYKWFKKTFTHLKEIQMDQLRDPDRKDQNLPEISNVNYSDCLKMIYHKAYQKAAHKKILPQYWNSGTPIKVKDTVRSLEDPLPNKELYQNIVSDKHESIHHFLAYIYRMKKQNFLI